MHTRTTTEFGARAIDDRYCGPKVVKYRVLLPNKTWREVTVRGDERPTDVVARMGYDADLCLFELQK